MKFSIESNGSKFNRIDQNNTTKLVIIYGYLLKKFWRNENYSIENSLDTIFTGRISVKKPHIRNYFIKYIFCYGANIASDLGSQQDMEFAPNYTFKAIQGLVLIW